MIGKMLNRFLHNGLGGREGAASQLERGQQWGLHITLGVLYVFCVFFFSLAVLFVFLSYSHPRFSPGLEMWIYC